MNDEETIILNRLLVDERSLKRLLKAAKQHISQETGSALFQLEWSIFNLHITSLRQQITRIEQEIAQLKIQSTHLVTQSTILVENQKEFKQEMDREIAKFDQIHEYNEICNKINSFPSSNDCELEIKALQNELLLLQDERNKLNEFVLECNQQINHICELISTQFTNENTEMQ